MHLSQNLSKGSVFDVSKKRLEALLKAYDKQSYLEWRPKIRQWQIRRKPDFKFSFKIGETNGKSIFMLFTVENEVDSSILDLPALNYHVLKKLREMDMWTNAELREQLYDPEYLQRKYQEKLSEQKKAWKKYYIKHHKELFKKLQEDVQSGLNPYYWITGAATPVKHRR